MNGNKRIDIGLLVAANQVFQAPERIDTAATNLTRLLVAMLGLKGCSLFALNSKTGELEVLASAGMSTQYLNKGPLLFEKSMAGRAASDPIVISDTADTRQLQYPEAAQAEGIKAMASMPVLFRDKVVGVLRLYSDDAWEPSADDVNALQLLAENIGMVMMVSRLSLALAMVKETVDGIHRDWLAQ